MKKIEQFDLITKTRFEKPSKNVELMLNCEPVKRDGFLKRLFTNPDKKKKKKFRGLKLILYFYDIILISLQIKSSCQTKNQSRHSTGISCSFSACYCSLVA